jgi:hypothetical protein
MWFDAVRDKAVGGNISKGRRLWCSGLVLLFWSEKLDGSNVNS